MRGGSREVHSSSLICKVGEDTVEGCAEEERHSGAPMRSEGYFDPTKPRAELEQDQDHVDQPQDEYDRNPTDLHIKSSNDRGSLDDYFVLRRAFATVINAAGLCDDLCILHYFYLDLFDKFRCLG